MNVVDVSGSIELGLLRSRLVLISPRRNVNYGMSIGDGCFLGAGVDTGVNKFLKCGSLGCGDRLNQGLEQV